MVLCLRVLVLLLLFRVRLFQALTLGDCGLELLVQDAELLLKRHLLRLQHARSSRVESSVEGSLGVRRSDGFHVHYKTKGALDSMFITRQKGRTRTQPVERRLARCASATSTRSAVRQTVSAGGERIERRRRKSRMHDCSHAGARNASKMSCLDDDVPGALVLFSCEACDLEVRGHLNDEEHRTGGKRCSAHNELTTSSLAPVKLLRKGEAMLLLHGLFVLQRELVLVFHLHGISTVAKDGHDVGAFTER
jgi:hypothetical protein